MTRQHRFALGALVWVVVVAAGATLVWTVISHAGAGVAGELPTTTVTSSASASAGPKDRPSRTASARPSSSAPGTPGTPGTSGTPQPAGPRQHTWQGDAGRVVAECQGDAISLVGAQAASGWSVDPDETGPEKLRVEFENSDDGRVRVEASCVGGAPAFTVGTERED